MTAIASLLTVGRFIIHWREHHKLHWDDWLNTLALIFLVTVTIIFEVCIPVEYNAILYRKGLSNRSPAQIDAVRNMKLNVTAMLLFFCTIYSVKESLLALYWQIFWFSRRFRIAWFSLMAYIVSSFIVTIVTVFTRCGAARYFANIGDS